MTNKEIITTVIDNWLEPLLANYLHEYLLKDIPYKAGAKANPNSTCSFLSGEVPPGPLINFLAYKIKHLRPIVVTRVYTNLQYSNMESDFHTDDGDITFLYMASKGLNSDEGSFEIKNEEKTEYRFNRLIYFDAKKLHKGNPPKQNIPRITLAFKTNTLL